MTSVHRLALIAALAAPLALTACSNAKKSLGLERETPDEFKVVTRAPLALPPDFNLRPPQPGAPRPQEPAPQDMARAALTGMEPGMSGSSGLSGGESALLSMAQTNRAVPGIRDIVNRETSVLAEEDQSFTDRLVFWREQDPEYGTALDPEKENQRLRENQSLGRPVTTGQTPVIERRQKGLLEGIF